jgi:hypothetical protein
MAAAAFLTWLTRPRIEPPVVRSLTPAQRRAYKESFDYCYKRIIVSSHPMTEFAWKHALRRFEQCTEGLGAPIKTTWESKERKWKWEVVYPWEQAP